MTEQDYKPVIKMELDDVHRHQLVKYVEDMGRSRREHGILRDEPDFLAGAMSAMAGLGIDMPLKWYFTMWP
jgi:hypothetical protein